MFTIRLSLMMVSLCLALSALTQTRFDNSTSFDVPDLGPATLYPSSIEVAGMGPYLSDIQVTIPFIFYTGDYEEMEMLLESPDGQQFLLMSDVDLGPFFGLFTDLTFSLNADQVINRQTADNINPFLPSDYGSTPDTLPAPGPGIVNGLPKHLYPLEGINPNGTWKLYVYNSRENQVGGAFNEGWELVLTSSSEPVCPRPFPPTIREGSLTTNQVIVDWGSYTVNDFDLYFGPTPLSEPSPATEATLTDITDTTQLLDNLLPNVKYELFLRSNCGESQGAWLGPVTFEMEEECPAVLPALELCQFYGPEDLATTQGWDIDPSGTQDLEAFQYTFTFTPPQSGVYTLEDFALLDVESDLVLAISTTDGSCNEKEGWEYFYWNPPFVELPFLEAGTTYTFVYQTGEEEVALRINPCQTTFSLSMPNFLEGPYSFKPQLLDNNTRAEGDFDLYYGPSPLPTPDGETVPTIQVTDIQIDQIFGGNLLPDTDYDLYFRRHCEGQVSCWSKPFNFRTEEDCGNLVYQGQENTTATTVSLAFLAENAVSNWIFEFGPAGYTPGENGIRVSQMIENDAIGFQLEGLQPETDYDLYYIPSCSANGLNPTYGPLRFSTNNNCDALATPVDCGILVDNRFESGDRAPVQAGTSCSGGSLFASKLYSFLAGATGTARIEFGGSGASSNSARASFSYAEQEGSCAIGSFTGLGCWLIQGNEYPNLFMPVEAGKRYFVLCQVSNVTGAGRFARFDFTIENCGFLPGQCPPIDQINAEPFTGDNIRLNWSTISAECYDILYGPVDEPLDTNTMTPQEECWPNEFFVITRENDLRPYQYYIRSRCNNEFTPWVYGRYPAESALVHQSVGSMDFCSRYFTQDDASRSYSNFSFKTGAGGLYTFKVQTSAESLTSLAIYQDTISEATLVSFADGFGIFEGGALLEQNTSYLARYEAPTPPIGGFVEFVVETWGLFPFAEIGNFDNSFDYPAAGLVGETNGWQIADYNCLGAENWRHFYDDNETPTNRADDRILLSIQDYSGLLNALNSVAAGGSPGASLITNPPADYIQNESGIVIMNRYWEVNLNDNQQPSSPVSVRFYWHLDDFDQLQIKMEQEGLTTPNNFSNLFFYKINGDYNPDPTAGHAGIPMASDLAGNGYWEYYFNEELADNYYQLGAHVDGNPYVEFPVAVFSGGGGGAAADGGGAILVDIVETNAPVDYWQVYPNPVQDQLFLRDLPRITEYALASSQGAIVQQGTFPSQGLDMSQLSPGYYVLQLQDALFNGTFKIVVMK